MTTDHLYPSKNLRMNHVVITNDNNDEDDYDNNDMYYCKCIYFNSKKMTGQNNIN